MLTPREQELIRLFLRDLPSEDLLALSSLITQRNLKPTSNEDALDIICQHSECIESVLEKKRITKRYLSEYLHKNRISVIHAWDKPALIRKTLDYWNIVKVTATVIEDVNNAPSVAPSTSTDIEQRNSKEYYTQLSYKFVDWFYSLINDDDVSKIGPEHFFVDSRIKLALESENCTDVIEASNSTDVASSLRNLRLKYNLKFQPNLMPDAVRFQCDIHGQVMVMVGGTLHSSDSQVQGLFEQIFLLIRDPSDNGNWKIKNSQINLRSSNPAIQSPNPSADSVLSILS